MNINCLASTVKIWLLTISNSYLNGNGVDWRQGRGKGDGEDTVHEPSADASSRTPAGGLTVLIVPLW